MVLTGCSERPSELPGDGTTRLLPVSLPESFTQGYSAKDLKRLRSIIADRKLGCIYQLPSLPRGLAMVQRYDAGIGAAADESGVPAWLLRGLVVVEASGRPDAIDHVFLSGQGRYAHVGLCQIGPHEASEAGIGARLDLETSVRAQIRRVAGSEQSPLQRATRMGRRTSVARAMSETRRLDALIARWRKSDERFDPKKNLLAAGRLLKAKIARYAGDLTLAVASYHAGGGNLDEALGLYFTSVADLPQPPDRNHVSHLESGGSWRKARTILRQRDRDFRAQLRKHHVRYLDLYRQERGPLFNRMSRWSDYSRTYVWKVLAAADIADRYLNAPEEYRQELEIARAS
ncbi:MAG TPA: lytic transglycosylase domain-containing protein [Armatimonadota bacterium]|jgi:hypothetical protein